MSLQNSKNYYLNDVYTFDINGCLIAYKLQKSVNKNISAFAHI